VRYTNERLEYYEFLCASNDAIYYFVCVMLMGRGTENDKHKIPESLGIYQLDMGKSRHATIRASYWHAQSEEENRWQRKISL
jgi:hypothetical protein